MPNIPQAPPQDHVLLIGIDVYDGNTTPLGGCVNDIDVIQRLLVDRIGISPARITRLASPRYGEAHETDVAEQPATLANIRAALARLGSDEVAPGDRVFIYHSGHGTQVQVVEPGRPIYVREALVPKDYIVRVTEPQYLFDWELGPLLAAIATRTSAITFVIDACCSTGTTRGPLEATSSRARYFESPKPYHLDAPLPPSSDRRGLTRSLAGTVQTCQVVAACLDDERARESDDEHGIRHGELTRALVAELANIPNESLAELRWGRLWPQLLTRVHAANPAQHPWMSGSHARRVFGGPPEAGDMGYGVTRDGDQYQLNVGELFGITKGAELAVYGSEPLVFPPVDSAADKALRPRRIRVIDADRATARTVAIDGPFALPPGARARLVKAGEAARLRVSISPANEAIARCLRESALVELAGEPDPSDLQVMQRDDGSWALLDDVFGFGDSPREPWLIHVPAKDLSVIRTLVEHYYGYSLPIRFAKLCQDLPQALRVSLHTARNAAQLSPAESQELHRFPELARDESTSYVLEVGEGDAATTTAPACVGVHNTSSVDLLVTLIACNTSGRVEVLSQKPIPGGGAHVFWSGDTPNRPFDISRPQGHSTCIDRIIAIGTTNRKTSLKNLEQTSSFAEILTATTRGAADKDIGANKSGPPPELWTADIITLRLVSP
jgi:Caspase domain